MAAAPNASSAGIFAFILCLCVVAASSASPCADGTYLHEGKKCCLCAVGMRVIDHCTTNLQYGICGPCENHTYISVPNGQLNCERCTSCLHINANQVVETNCTPGADTKCRCKDDHFCPDSKGICTICNPCTKCGAEGIKVACKGNSDTVCNEKNEGGSNVGKDIVIVGVIAGTASIAIGIGVFLYKKRQRGSKVITVQSTSGNENEALIIPDEVNLVPHLPDLARVIGWKDMQNIALRSNIQNTVIESCQLDHPHDAYEQTLQLLQTWNEKQGRGAGNKLKQILQDIDKKRKAEEVTNILLPEVNLVPHIPDLARVIGWKDMQNIALRSSIQDTIIESCQLDHPHDAYEQTLQLLQIWNEKQGRGAGNKLKQILQDIDKKRKAEEVTNILLPGARNNSPV